jgi:hypothetical protein
MVLTCTTRIRHKSAPTRMIIPHHARKEQKKMYLISTQRNRLLVQRGRSPLVSCHFERVWTFEIIKMSKKRAFGAIFQHVSPRYNSECVEI